MSFEQGAPIIIPICMYYVHVTPSEVHVHICHHVRNIKMPSSTLLRFAWR